MALQNGVYRIATKQNINQVLDVKGAAITANATIQLYHNHDGNNQKFLLKTITGDYVNLRALHSGKVADLKGAKAVPKSDFGQHAWKPNDMNNQLWRTTDAGNIVFNGTTYNCKIIRSRLKSTLVVDARGEKSADKTEVFIYSYHGKVNQQWAFIKDTRYSETIAVPANVGFASSMTGGRNTVLYCNKTTRYIYPYWKCQGTYWQLRWRWRGRKTGTNTWSGWTAWRSISNTSVANNSLVDEGWGNAWTYNVKAASSGGVCHASRSIGVNVDQVTYDKKEIQLCVRKFAPNNVKLAGTTISSHGGSTTQTISCIYKPTITIPNAISFSPDGLQIPIKSDFRRNGNTAALTSIKIGNSYLFNGVKWAKDIPYQGAKATFTLPLSDLRFIPADNSTATVTLQYDTIDGSWVYTLTTKILYNSDHGISISYTAANAAGWTDRITVRDAGINEYDTKTTRCWLLSENEGRTNFIECSKDSSGRFIVVPPLNKPYKLYLSVQTYFKGVKSAWGTRMITMPAKSKCKYYLFNWGTNYAVLPWDASASWGIDRDESVEQTQGRYFESVFFGKGSSRKITVSGRLLDNDGVDHSSPIDFEKLSVANYGVVRFPSGERFELAVEKVSFKIDHARYRDVTVEGREVS